MLGALQHLSKREFETIVDDLFIRLPLGVDLFFLGSVLDREGKWVLLNSVNKRMMYAYYVLTGRDLLGRFWSWSEIEALSRRRHLDCHFYVGDLSSDRPAAKFRFDATIMRPGAFSKIGSRCGAAVP